MAEVELIKDVGVVFITALASGIVAHRLKQPLIVGYLLGGLLVGPYGLGLVASAESVSILAELGVALLMFTIGVEFSLAALQRVRNISVIGGSVQMLAIIALGIALGWAFKLGLYPSLYLGCIMAISSTMVVVKLLDERGELDSLHGRVIVGILVVQDLGVVAMAALLPSIANVGSLAFALLISSAKAALVLLLTFYLALKTVPAIMARVAHTKNRELFLLVNLALALGIAVFTSMLGFTASLGAFLAGLIISESKFSYEALAKIMPLRDVFVILFFVSIGMLINPFVVLANPSLLLAVLAAIVLGKFVVLSLIPLAYGYGGRTAIYTGASMVQIGEFSFVLAKLGLDANAISESLYSITLGSALVTIILTPLLLGRAPAIYSMVKNIWVFKRMEAELPPTVLSGHAIICGYGRVGKIVGKAFDEFGVKSLVIEHDHILIDELRTQGIPCIYGDASDEEIVARASPEDAIIAVIALPDAFSARLAIRNLLRFNPSLQIVARAHGDFDREAFYEEGVMEVVQPEYEAGIEMVRHSLTRLRVPPPTLRRYMRRLHGEQDKHLVEEWIQSELAVTHRVKEVEVGPQAPFQGRSIKDSNLREEFGLSIIAVRKKNGELVTNPLPDTKMELGDRLMVFGPEERLKKFEAFAGSSSQDNA